MCHEYSYLAYKYIILPAIIQIKKNETVDTRDYIDKSYNSSVLEVGGQNASPKEFPHMVITNTITEIRYRLFMVFTFRFCRFYWVITKDQFTMNAVEDR